MKVREIDGKSQILFGHLFWEQFKRYTAGVKRGNPQYTVLLFILILAFPGWGFGEPTINVTDHRGKQHQFRNPPDRVVSLSPVSTELLFAIGAGHRIVGRTSYCNFPAEVAKIRDIGSLFPPDYEAIVAQKPSLIAMSDGNLKVRERLETLGIPVFVIQPRSLSDIGRTMITLGDLMGTQATARSVSARFHDELKRLAHPSKTPITVMYEVWSKPLTTAGQDTFVADIIRISGGRNLVQSGSEDWPRISNEWAVSQNPDVILTTGTTQRDRWLIEGVPGWTHTTAVKQRQVFAVPNEDVFVRPGPRVIEAVKWLRNKLLSLEKAH